MTEVRKAAVILEAGTKDYSVIMTMTPSMITSAHPGKATEAEFIAEIHKQYRVGQNTNGSKKKHQKISTRHLLLRCVVSSSDAMVTDRLGTIEITAPTRNKAVLVEAAVVMKRDPEITTRKTAPLRFQGPYRSQVLEESS